VEGIAGWVKSLPSSWTAGCGPQVFAAARESYASAARFYHTWDHVLDCTQKLRDFECASPRAAFLALLFHDAVYVPGRPDNEAKSALFARELLREYAQLERAEIELVARIILATRDHRLADGSDRDTAVVLDIDMSILGAPWARYRQYADDVRAEYVPAAASARRFAAGRIAFLSALLAGGPIFHTAPGFERWERAARENVARELENLRRSAGILPRLMARIAARRSS
jgi:predicted metal-dependent HD superfamily phosphohydrolase